jgi:hypothetical protein
VPAATQLASCPAGPAAPEQGFLAKHSASLLPFFPLLPTEPGAVIQSFSEVLEPTLQETCYPALLELYSELRSMG